MLPPSFSYDLVMNFSSEYISKLMECRVCSSVDISGLSLDYELLRVRGITLR
jgi:hypothetical protein